MAKSALTPTDLAKRIGRAGPRVNTVLRKLYPQLAPGVGRRWLLTDEIVEAVTAYFAGSSSQNAASGPAADSAEQRAAESTMLELLGRELGVTFAKHCLVSDGGATVEVDGGSLLPPILVECFAHQGTLRVGQKHKVTNDAFKLAWAGTTLLPGARKILLFSDRPQRLRSATGAGQQRPSPTSVSRSGSWSCPRTSAPRCAVPRSASSASSRVCGGTCIKNSLPVMVQEPCCSHGPGS